MFYEVLGDEPVSPEKKAAIQELLQANKEGKNLILTSVITHLEVVPKKLEAKKPGALGKYLSLFDGKKFLDVEISRNILMRAREIRDYYYRPADTKAKICAKVMDSADAVHLATASIFGANEFNTRDDDSKGSKIPLVSLYQWSGASDNKLCGKYSLVITSPEHAQKVFDLDNKIPPARPAQSKHPDDSKEP
jgi:predicted nucleic acid-binding protein